MPGFIQLRPSAVQRELYTKQIPKKVILPNDCQAAYVHCIHNFYLPLLHVCHIGIRLFQSLAADCICNVVLNCLEMYLTCQHYGIEGTALFGDACI